MITVYVLDGSSTGKRYVGITNSLQRRLAEHRACSTKGSQIIGAFTLLHTEMFSDYAAARIREKFLKSGRGRAWLRERYPVEARLRRVKLRPKRACPPLADSNPSPSANSPRNAGGRTGGESVRSCGKMHRVNVRRCPVSQRSVLPKTISADEMPASSLLQLNPE